LDSKQKLFKYQNQKCLIGVNMDDSMQLGGNIELSGFKDIDGASMVVLKKIIGNYGRRFSELSGNFESLKITMKPVHETEKSEKYEIHVQVIVDGKPVASEVIERNLFIAIDNALKKVESQLS
jgi:ribosome-associated translation inhibitor RaiA